MMYTCFVGHTSKNKICVTFDIYVFFFFVCFFIYISCENKICVMTHFFLTKTSKFSKNERTVIFVTDSRSLLKVRL